MYVINYRVSDQELNQRYNPNPCLTMQELATLKRHLVKHVQRLNPDVALDDIPALYWLYRFIDSALRDIDMHRSASENDYFDPIDVEIFELRRNS